MSSSEARSLKRMVGSRTRIAVLVVAGVLCAPIAAAIALVPAPSAAPFQLHAADLPPRTGISPVNYTLYGNAVGGWGFSSTTILEPGPDITVFYGARVKLTLIGTDSAPHSWFIDYNDDMAPSPGEPASKDFNVPGDVVGTLTFLASQTGNWTYRCHVHPTSMTGTISIVGGPPPELPRTMLPLVTEIMIGALGIVLVFAAVYHFRAVRAAKRLR